MYRVIIFVFIVLPFCGKGQTLEEQIEQLTKLVKDKDVTIKELRDSTKINTSFLDSITELSSRLNRDFDGDKKERVQLGLSFAYGEIQKDDKPRFRLPTISPSDSILVYQNLDGRFVLVSTTMTVTPFLYSDWIKTVKNNMDTSSKARNWKRAGLWLLENSGFSVNINFLEIATGESQQSFNQVVEGGIGYSLRLNKNIYFSLTRELKFLNSLNDSFEEGDPILLDGNKIGSIDELSINDQDYYHNSSLLHWSMRLIINF